MYIFSAQRVISEVERDELVETPTERDVTVDGEQYVAQAIDMFSGVDETAEVTFPLVNSAVPYP